MQKTFKYTIFSLLLLFCFLSANGQVKKIQKDTIRVNLYNGVRLDVDLVPIVNTILSTSETFSYQAALQADLQHKYYPIVEIGYAGANKISTSNIGFKTNAMFGKLGVDFGLMKEKKGVKPTNNLFLAGVRLGFSNFKYSYNNVSITNDYWDENLVLNYENISTTKVWIEIVAGMRVEIFKNVFLGWTVRNKSLMDEDAIGKLTPWYIPGFGKNTGTANWEVNYVIGYKF